MNTEREDKCQRPVGYYDFYRNKHFNFTMNRWHSIGLAGIEDLRMPAGKIKKYEDWKPEMMTLAAAAGTEKRLANAALYFRAAELCQIGNLGLALDTMIDWIQQKTPPLHIGKNIGQSSPGDC